MAALNNRPGSSTKRQHQTLVTCARRRGFTLAEVRKMVGGSITRLSAAECSQWIERFSGRGLPHPPGKKPGPYAGKKTTGAMRMIADDHIEQIVRLGLEYFGTRSALLAWLSKDFGVPFVDPRAYPLEPWIRRLGTARRAAEVIVVLKGMIKRRAAKQAAAAQTGKDEP